MTITRKRIAKLLVLALLLPLLLGLLAQPQPAMAANMTIDISALADGANDGDGGDTWVYDAEDFLLTVKKSNVTLEKTNHNLTVIVSDGVSLALQDVTITGNGTHLVGIYTAGQNCTLVVTGTNSVTGVGVGAGVCVPSSSSMVTGESSLTIEGPGKLTARGGGDGGAGIGASYGGGANGPITIKNADIEAFGGTRHDGTGAAGIGGGSGAEGRNITIIENSTVSAKGGDGRDNNSCGGGAGIGGGGGASGNKGGAASNITIDGTSTVTAVGGAGSSENNTDSNGSGGGGGAGVGGGGNGSYSTESTGGAASNINIVGNTLAGGSAGGAGGIHAGGNNGGAGALIGDGGPGGSYLGGARVRVSANPVVGGYPSADPSNGQAGVQVALSANPNADYRFDSWTATGVTLTSPTDAAATFIMPDNVVTITANYTYVGSTPVNSAPLLPDGGSAISFIPLTLTNAQYGVTVSGNGIANISRLIVQPNKLHAEGTCKACDEIRAQNPLAVYDISLSNGHRGPVDVYIPFSGSGSYTVLHCNKGVLEEQSALYASGGVSTTWNSLSPFAVVQTAPTIIETPDDDVEVPQTGDSTGLVWLVLYASMALATVGLRKALRARNTQR